MARTPEPIDSSQDLTIEVGRDSWSTHCDHCGRGAVHTTGFVYRAGDALAIYHATLHHHDNVHRADLAIGIGTWQTDAAVADVSAFLTAWSEGDEIRFGFVDPADSVWSSAGLLQNQLTADQARAHSARIDLLSVAEGVVRGDPEVARHLG
jgi:hypothetical protein